MFQWDMPSVVVVVYDCTSETSFDSCEKWLQRVRQQSPDVVIPGLFCFNLPILGEYMGILS